MQLTLTLTDIHFDICMASYCSANCIVIWRLFTQDVRRDILHQKCTKLNIWFQVMFAISYTFGSFDNWTSLCWLTRMHWKNKHRVTPRRQWQSIFPPHLHMSQNYAFCWLFGATRLRQLKIWFSLLIWTARFGIHSNRYAST